MIKILKLIPDNLLWIVLIVGTFSLFFPRLGSSLGWTVAPVLALMMLNVSMTIKWEDLYQIRKYPLIIMLGVFLQFVPMTLFSLLMGKLLFHSGYINTGQILLGCLPGDISAPLMVYLVGGSTAIATAMLIAAMALTPFILPNVVTWLSGITFNAPTSYLVMELTGIIIVPVVIGILLNRYSKQVRENETAWSGIASLCYITLLFVVVSSNAETIIALKTFALLILLVEIALNFFGYGLAFLTKYILRQKETFLPLLFLVGSKEFGIASASAKIMNLNNSVVIPSAFYAVVQMISLPIMVKIINKSSAGKKINTEK